MTNMFRLNIASNYATISADFGINRECVPDKAAFAIDGHETVRRAEIPYERAHWAYVRSLVDEVDTAIIEEVARSKYLVSLQVYQFLILRGFDINRKNVRNRLNKLVKYRLLREFEICRDGAENGLRYYEIDYRGFQIAQESGVPFHVGNHFLSDRKKEEVGFIEDPVVSKRVLVANMVILGLLRNGAALDTFSFNETVRAIANDQIVGDRILRTQGMFCVGEDVFLLEVIRSGGDNTLSKLTDKVQRYYSLVKDSTYLNGNAHSHTALPQLIICAESEKHSKEIDQYLRSEGLWSAKDTLLYTHDLLYLKESLRVLYELQEDGTARWYSIPSRCVQQTRSCA